MPDAVVNAYWSVILVDLPNYPVVPNPLNRFNFNSDSGLKSEADGSLKILFAKKAQCNRAGVQLVARADGKGFSLTIRAYVPKDLVKRGEWFPPAIQRLK